MDQSHFTENLTDPFCESYNLDRLQFQLLLNFIHAPVSLDRFNLITKSLAGISKYVIGSDCALGVSNQILEVIDQLVRIEPSLYSDITKPWASKGVSLPHNLIGDHPEYALLVQKYDPAIEENIAYKWHLSWAVLVASQQYRQLAKVHQFDLNSSIWRASLAVRKLDQLKNWPSKLPPLIRSKQSLDSYIDAFEEYVESLETWGKDIYSLFKALKEQKSRIKRSSKERSSGRASIQVIVDSTPELPNTPALTSIIEAAPEKKQEELDRSGLSKDELTTPRLFKITEKTPRKDSAGTLKNLVYRQRAKLNGIKSNNQLLLHSWQMASPYELGCLIKGLDGEFKPSDDSCALICIQLWSGRALEEVINCQRCTFSELQINKPGSCLSWVSDKKLLAIPTQSPTYRKEHDQSLMSHPSVDGRPHQANAYFLVKLPPNATKAISEASHGKSSKRIFAFTEAEATLEMNAFFKKLNDESICDIRLKTNRVARTFSYALKAVGASHADILLMTNHRFTHAERSLSYYHTTPGHLQQLHQQAVNWLIGYVSGSQTKGLDLSHSTPGNSIVTGAQIRLTRSLAKKMTGHMLKDLTKSREDLFRSRLPSKSKHLIQFHNHFTYYTLKLFQFCSGYRAVNDPIENINLVDDQTGFIAISDKDNDTYSQSRIVPLPPRCIEQLDAYALHLSNLSKHTNNAQLHKHLSDIFQHPDQTKFGFLFYLDENQNPVRALSEQMNHLAIHHLPNNIYRHFLRTELQKAGIPAELISYFLGHWMIGEEPFQKFSTFSPLEFFEDIRSVIQRLAVETGWTVQRGVS